MVTGLFCKAGNVGHSLSNLMVEFLPPVQNLLAGTIALVLTLMQFRQFLGGAFHLLAQGLIFFRLLLQGPLQINDFLIEPLFLCCHRLHQRIGTHGIITQRSQLFIVFLLFCRFLCIIISQFAELAAPEFFLQTIVNPRLFRMTGQRLQLVFNLVDDILHTHKVVFRIRKLSNRLALTVAVLRNSRRFLKEGPAVFRTAV